VTLCAVCIVHMKMRSVCFFIEHQNQGFQFFGLDLKISSCGLVICPIKSPRQFLGFVFKIKQATIYRLCHKIDGIMIRRDAHIEI
jgi:hypothetical protein